MRENRLFAIRGATQCLNTEEDIQKQIVETYDELLLKNTLSEKEIVSVFLSVTGDLNAKNPATALRSEGRAVETALFVSQEANFEGSLERVIRLLIHCYLDSSKTPVHVYRNGAQVLRPDWAPGMPGT